MPYDMGRQKFHTLKFRLPTSYSIGIGALPRRCYPIWAPWWVEVSGTNTFESLWESTKTNKTVDKQNRTRVIMNLTLPDLAAALLLAGLSPSQLRPATGNSFYRAAWNADAV